MEEGRNILAIPNFGARMDRLEAGDMIRFRSSYDRIRLDRRRSAGTGFRISILSGDS